MTRPRIALTPRLVSDDNHKMGVNLAYLEALSKNGAKAYIVHNDYQSIDDYVEEFDGLLVCGGDDITLKYLNGEIDPKDNDDNYRQDLFEALMMEAFEKAKKPIFGICRGLQLYNVLKGGTLYQDIDKDYKDLKGLHSSDQSFRGYRHEVTIKKDSSLYRIIDRERIKVNSFHHQAIKDLGRGLSISAVCDDGIIEAIESEHFIGVQWHPEKLNDEASFRIFRAFIEMCR